MWMIHLSYYSCKEEYIFNQVPKWVNINYSNYPVINEDNICINNDDEYNCKEQIPCLKFKSNNTNDCYIIIASSQNKKCLANPDYIEGDNSDLSIEKYFYVNILKNDIKDNETIINDDLIISNENTHAWINEINSESEN